MRRTPLPVRLVLRKLKPTNDNWLVFVNWLHMISAKYSFSAMTVQCFVNIASSFLPVFTDHP
jgi:hypothetical protein